MKAPRAYMPSESVPEPNAADVAEGIVSPMDIPIHTPIPLLRLKSCEFRKNKARSQSYRSWLKREGRKPYVCKAMRRLRKLERYRSSFGLPITPFEKKAKRLRDSMDENSLVEQNQCSLCQCISCKHLRRWSTTLEPYRCPNVNCRITFTSFLDLFEHQLDVHGRIDPRDNRFVSELYHQQRGVLALPPCTVYVGQQLLFPSRPPTVWNSMEELDEEARTLAKRLLDSNPSFSVRPYKMFTTAYELVKRNGWKEMKQQYHIAIEHYFSALKYPAQSRGFHDGCPSVERGRNWLTSTDREDARLLFPFSLGDKVDVEPEIVVIDTKPGQNAYVDLSSHESDEAVSAGGNTSSEQGSNTSDHVEMPELNIDGIQFEKKQIKLENDSDGEHSSIDNQADDFPLDSESEEEKAGKIEDGDSSNDVSATSYKHILSSSDTASDADTDCSKHASKIAQLSSKASSDSEDQDDSSVSDTDSDGDGVTFPDNLLVSSEDSSDDDVPRNQSEESDSDTDTQNSGEN